MDTNIDYTKLNNELADMEEDLKLTKYHDRVVNDQLTKEEKIARNNMNKVLNMSMEDFLMGKFDDLQ